MCLSVSADSRGAVVWAFLTSIGGILTTERLIAWEDVPYQRNREMGDVGAAQLGRLVRGRRGAKD